MTEKNQSYEEANMKKYSDFSQNQYEDEKKQLSNRLTFFVIASFGVILPCLVFIFFNPLVTAAFETKSTFELRSIVSMTIFLGFVLGAVFIWLATKAYKLRKLLIVTYEELRTTK